MPAVVALLLAGAALPPVPLPVIVVEAPLPRPPVATPVPDAELATMRGGVRLPNGLTVSLGIDLQTWIDGRLALHTVYASEGAATGVRVFTDGTNPVKTAPATQTISTGAVQGIPVLQVDRSPTGTTIVPADTVAATTVNLVNGDPSNWLSGEGQARIPVTANGPAVDAAPGRVSLTTGAAGTVVTLATPTLEVRQLVGQATGVVVANTADDRSIDTVSSVNVDLQGISPAMLAGIFAAQRAVLQALQTR